MEFVTLKPEDGASVYGFYHEVITGTPDLERYAKWKEGVHPGPDEINAFLQKGVMFGLRYEGNLLACMTLLPYQTEEYRAVTWQGRNRDDEVTSLHIFAVHPAYARRGLGRRMIDEALRLTKIWGKAALRLDTLITNTPAQAFYRSCGFTLCGRMTHYASNTGWIEFLYYEKRL